MRITDSYIFLDNVRFHAFHGVMPQERKVGADFAVSLKVGVDLSRPVVSDEVTDTLNYAKLISGVLRYRMPIDHVIKLVSSLQLKSESINTWKVGVERALKKYIVDGTEAKGQKCPNCGSESLVYQEGCLICKNCGASRCG